MHPGAPSPQAAGKDPGASPRRIPEERVRLAAAAISFVVGLVLLGVKVAAWRITGSSAVLSDALESIVNVVAALFAVGGVLFAGRPADRGHPYGHGKIEFFTAAFEGGLISFAALLVLAEAARAFLHGPVLRRIDTGLLLLLGAGLVNGLLGRFLIRTGRRYQSLTLEADGHHVFSDFLTSIGVAAGLVLVRWTGQAWIDPLVAGLVGLNLIRTGWKLVRQAAGGLLDEEDGPLLERLVGAAESVASTGIIRLRNLRVIRAGRFHHVDARLVVPEFWDVSRAHDAADAFQRKLLGALGLDGEVVFQLDPCRRHYCPACDAAECPVRKSPFARRSALTVEEAVQSDPPILV